MTLGKLLFFALISSFRYFSLQIILIASFVELHTFSDYIKTLTIKHTRNLFGNFVELHTFSDYSQKKLE